MYGLPPDLDLSFFNGRTLEQVCIGANELILNFDEYLSVTVVSRIGCSMGNDSQRFYDDFREAAALVVKFIGDTIVASKGDSVGTLTLEFTGGGRLSLFDDSKQFESYVIKHGESVIVV
jgi:hypothetical protein